MINKFDNAFKIYDEYLVKKRFTIKCEDDTQIILVFKPSNFLHLTGASHKVKPIKFYKMYKRNVISKKDIIFSHHSPIKLDVFEHLKLTHNYEVTCYKAPNNYNVVFFYDHLVSKNKPIIGEKVKGIIINIESIK